MAFSGCERGGGRYMELFPHPLFLVYGAQLQCAYLRIHRGGILQPILLHSTLKWLFNQGELSTR